MAKLISHLVVFLLKNYMVVAQLLQVKV